MAPWDYIWGRIKTNNAPSERMQSRTPDADTILLDCCDFYVLSTIIIRREILFCNPKPCRRSESFEQDIVGKGIQKFQCHFEIRKPEFCQVSGYATDSTNKRKTSEIRVRKKDKKEFCIKSTYKRNYLV